MNTTANTNTNDYEFAKLVVVPRPDTKRPGNMVARVPSNYPDPRYRGMLCFFDRDSEAPKASEEVHVMILGVLWHKTAPYNHNDYSQKPKALFIRAVTDDDILVYHRGFECGGSMCSTTAIVVAANQPKIGKGISLSPGRLNGVIRVADNVNRGPKWGTELMTLTPGRAYISNKYLLVCGSVCRIEGVPNINDLEFFDLETNVRYGTQGGGVVEYDTAHKAYVFVVPPPNQTELTVGSYMPTGWSLGGVVTSPQYGAK